jgi:hypothetical protein
MNKLSIRWIIPLAIIGGLVIYTWINILFSIYIATWRQYVGLAGFVILTTLFFINRPAAIIATGAFLLLATFNLLAITNEIKVSGITILSISTPPVQLLSLGIFILYILLNIDIIIDIYLAYKEKKSKESNISN